MMNKRVTTTIAVILLFVSHSALSKLRHTTLPNVSNIERIQFQCLRCRSGQAIPVFISGIIEQARATKQTTVHDGETRYYLKSQKQASFALMDDDLQFSENSDCDLLVNNKKNCILFKRSQAIRRFRIERQANESSISSLPSLINTIKIAL